MKRWGVCRIITDPETGGPEPAISLYPNVNYRIVHFGDPQWVLMQCAASDFTAINSDPDCIILPDLTLDSTWGQVPANVRNQAISRLQDAGFTTSDIKTVSTVREILNYLGRQIDVNFDCERGDVSDIEQ